MTVGAMADSTSLSGPCFVIAATHVVHPGACRNRAPGRVAREAGRGPAQRRRESGCGPCEGCVNPEFIQPR